MRKLYNVYKYIYGIILVIKIRLSLISSNAHISSNHVSVYGLILHYIHYAQYSTIETIQPGQVNTAKILKTGKTALYSAVKKSFFLFLLLCISHTK